MATFLLKTDPADYSLDDLAEDEFTTWNGVRNSQAVQTIRRMLPGDRALIYYSGKDPAIMGQVQILSDPRPDFDNDGSWVVDVKYLSHFEHPVSLREIKESGLFDDWALIRQIHLSTMEVPESFLVWFWNHVHPAL